MTHIYVGMSGGVDSSVTAALLVEQGYKVTGVYMKNWSQDLPGMKCPWAEDLADAKRVAVQLGIDFKVFDFEKEYKQNVVDYMIEEYSLGRTPNPDIMCNQEVKFKLFLDAALADGADMIATGHYARTKDGKLLRAVDENKDQTYFLCRVTSEALTKTLFPLGDYTKPEVRDMAKARGLWTASKKESMGVCFVGSVGMREFLSQYVTTHPGAIIDRATGKVLGRHDGAIFYTLGQRHGLDIGGGLPYYVVGKDMDKNEVYVSTNLNDGEMWRRDIELQSMHAISEMNDGDYMVRLRHRGALVPARVEGTTLQLAEAQRAITPGQSAVLYRADECVGSGIVS
ncbi:MAG: tRNA 2-thiouridine(34) synthase MnmA [Acidobacteriota bacterium]